MRVFDVISPQPTINVDDSLESISKAILDTSVHCVPVIDREGKIFGVITSSVLAQAILEHSNRAGVAAWEVCIREFPTIHPDTLLQDAMKEFHESPQNFMIVAENERYIGLITSSNLVSLTNLGEEGTEESDQIISPQAQVEDQV